MRSALSLLGALLFLARPASAAEVVLVRPAESDSFIDETFHRLTGELRQNAFVVREEPASAAKLEPPQAILARTHAQACIVLGWRAEASVVRIWLATPAGEPTLLEAVALERTVEAPTLLAGRSVDLLRLGLVRSLEPPAATEPAPPVKPAASPKATDYRWSIRLGAGLLNERSTFGNAWGPEFGLSRSLTPRLSVGARFTAPAWGADHQNADARARLVQGLVLAELEARLLRSEFIDAGFAAGLGAYWVHVDGELAQPIASQRGTSNTQWTSATSLGPFAVLAITDRLSLSVRGAAVLLLPRPRVLMGESSYGISEPLLSLGASLRWAL